MGTFLLLPQEGAVPVLFYVPGTIVMLSAARWTDAQMDPLLLYLLDNVALMLFTALTMLISAQSGNAPNLNFVPMEIWLLFHLVNVVPTQSYVPINSVTM